MVSSPWAPQPTGVVTKDVTVSPTGHAWARVVENWESEAILDGDPILGIPEVEAESLDWDCIEPVTHPRETQTLDPG